MERVDVSGVESEMDLKVCQLCAVDFTLKNFLLPLIDGMKDTGWEVIAVCSEGPNVAALRERGYHVENIPIARSLNPISALRSFWALFWLFRRQGFDIVHAHTPVAALIGRIAARLAGVPLVIYTAHGFYFHDEMPRWKRAVFVALERFAGKFTDFLFCQSAEDAAEAIKEGIASRDRVLAIGNGIDISRFDPSRIGDGSKLRRELGIPESAFVIGLIGRQVREKGIAEFLEAARRLATHDSNLWFLLIGERLSSDHADGVEAELYSARAALGQRLVSAGQRADVPFCLAAMNVFCLPSWREGMPRTIIEAMMMAKPVIATNIRGCREEVVPEETGLLVPTRSAEALANAIERLALDSSWARQLGENGRQRALELFDERRVVALQVSTIIRVMDQGNF